VILHAKLAQRTNFSPHSTVAFIADEFTPDDSKANMEQYQKTALKGSPLRRRTRSSSVATSESAAGYLWKYFSHKREETIAITSLLETSAKGVVERMKCSSSFSESSMTNVTF
jgi:hypothetical protein